ncbi:SCO family protein [Shimia ponticola]|uniref:SCO family protein n=1 Tax=Shimia ponticola TaxID=2582893 RepID=UPI0011BDCDBE|nr:SCO family protein [Shimia ponticola]
MARLMAWGGMAFVVLVVGGAFLFTQIRQPADRLAECLAGSVAGGDIGGPFTLVDETGRTVTDQDVINGPTLVYFGFTFCPDVCPLDNERNAIAMDILDEQGAPVDALFISIDPERDTPELLAEFTDVFHERMVGLTGTQEQVDEAIQAYRVYARKVEGDDPDYYLMDHSTFTYLVTPEEGFVTFFRRDLSPDQMAEQVACVAESV